MPIMTFRLTDAHLNTINKFRGNKTKTEIINQALEQYINSQHKNEDYQALLFDPCKAMNGILKKYYSHYNLTHDEFRFIGTRCHQTYLHAKTSVCSSQFINNNLSAFQKLYELINNNTNDDYYLGNMNGNEKSVLMAVESAKDTNPTTHPSWCEFRSRNLEAITMDIYKTDIVKINQILSPYLKDLIYLALRSFWSDDNQENPRCCESSKINTFQFDLKDSILKTSDDDFQFTFYLTRDQGNLIADLCLKESNYNIVFNNFLEIEEFANLMHAMSLENRNVNQKLDGKVFSILSNGKTVFITIKNAGFYLKFDLVKRIDSLVYDKLFEWDAIQNLSSKYGRI